MVEGMDYILKRLDSIAAKQRKTKKLAVLAIVMNLAIATTAYKIMQANHLKTPKQVSEDTEGV